MSDLDDQRHLEAAAGWFELGLHREANEELQKLGSQRRGHPDALELRWHICAKEKQWEECLVIAAAIIQRAPERAEGWIHRSFALHELRRTQEALDQLLPVAGRFRKVWTIPYNLACYASVLHQFGAAQQWLQQALALDPETVRQAARVDADLKPLRDSLGGTMWKRK